MVISIKRLIPNQVTSARQTRSGRINNLGLQKKCQETAFTWATQCKMHCNYRTTASLKERNFLMQQSSPYVPKVLIHSKLELYSKSAFCTVLSYKTQNLKNLPCAGHPGNKSLLTASTLCPRKDKNVGLSKMILELQGYGLALLMNYLMSHQSFDLVFHWLFMHLKAKDAN